jgi:hypothetical protein
MENIDNTPDTYTVYYTYSLYETNFFEKKIFSKLLVENIIDTIEYFIKIFFNPNFLISLKTVKIINKLPYFIFINTGYQYITIVNNKANKYNSCLHRLNNTIKRFYI